MTQCLSFKRPSEPDTIADDQESFRWSQWHFQTECQILVYEILNYEARRTELEPSLEDVIKQKVSCISHTAIGG
jgi:hypothetical protein